MDGLEIYGWPRNLQKLLQSSQMNRQKLLQSSWMNRQKPLESSWMIDKLLERSRMNRQVALIDFLNGNENGHVI